MSNADGKEYTKLDTFSKTTYFVRLAQDPKVFIQKEDQTHDVVLTFIDTSRFETHEDLWVDARVARHQADRAKKLRKGDLVQMEGKLRFKLENSGKYRGKIYDATFSSFTPLKDREEVGPGEPAAPIY